MWKLKYILFVPALITVCGCATGYNPSGLGGGYESERESYNVFVVTFRGNEFTSIERAKDLALMRAAEVSLENGFHYFIEFAGKGYEGIYPAYVGVIGCFRAEPEYLPSKYAIHNAKELFHKMAVQYELMASGKYIQPKVGRYKPPSEAIEFELYPDYDFEPLTGEHTTYTIKGFRNFGMEGVCVARYVDFENPMVSDEEFYKVAMPIAEKHGANAVILEDDRRVLKNYADYSQVENPFIGFVADLYVVPEASLGVEWEPGDLYMGKYIIRRFKRVSKAKEAGLRLSDKVIEINGIDMLNKRAFVEEFLKWSVGETARVSFVRDGEQQTLEVELVPNIP